MKNDALVEEWLKKAHSNLARAKAGKVSEQILYEDLCFDCQQAVEKSIKALLVQIESEFEKIHSISKLLKQVEDFGIMVPEEIKETSELSVYAVSTRYPGDYEPVSETEFKEALGMAEKAVKWIEEMIETLKQDKTDENNE